MNIANIESDAKSVFAFEYFMLPSSANQTAMNGLSCGARCSASAAAALASSRSCR
jgi:hypothetical protein